MKKYIKSILILSFMFLNTIGFAFPGSIDSGTSGQDDPQAPIDNYIYLVFVVAIGFGYWVYSKKSIKA